MFDGDEIDDRDMYAVRSSTAFMFGDNTEAHLTIQYFDEDDNRMRGSNNYCARDPDGIESFLDAPASPLPQIRFCPTGGIGPDNAMDYLSLPNTLCVGGSWVAPGDLVTSGDWAGITALAKAASVLSR